MSRDAPARPGAASHPSRLRPLPARRRAGRRGPAAAREQQLGQHPTTAVHEAYPGHPRHLVGERGSPRLPDTLRHQGLGPLRRTDDAGAGLLHRSAPGDELGQGAPFQGADGVDTSLHLAEMAVEEAGAFMQTRANLPEPTARAEGARYASWPTRAASYLTGCQETLAMPSRHFARIGRSDVDALRPSHDRLGERRAPTRPRRAGALGPVRLSRASAFPCTRR